MLRDWLARFNAPHPLLSPQGLKWSEAHRGVTILYPPGIPAHTPKDYEKLAKAGYASNPTVHACISLIARAGAGIPWLLYQEQKTKARQFKCWTANPAHARKLATKDWLEVEGLDHPLIKLIARPNPFQGTAAFMETLIGYLEMAGNTYINRVGPKTRNAPPEELWVLRPDRMHIIPHAIEMIEGYVYKVAGTEIARWQGKTGERTRDHILHLKLFHPTHDLYGLSPIEVSARSVDMENAADETNLSFMQKGMIPGWALVLEPSEWNMHGTLTDPQREKLKAQLNEEYSGPDKAGKPFVFEGGFKLVPLGQNTQDGHWSNTKKLSGQAICRVWNVPPELVGFPESKTYSNWREARQSLYTETVLPLMDRIRDELNRWLCPLFGENLRLDYDRDEIEALAEDRDRVWSRLTNAKRAAIITANDARPRMQFEQSDDPSADLLVLDRGSPTIPVEEPQDGNKVSPVPGSVQLVSRPEDGNGKDRLHKDS